jgi:protein-S-isoprenylcysteine O-methyltransferase Ste14
LHGAYLRQLATNRKQNTTANSSDAGSRSVRRKLCQRLNDDVQLASHLDFARRNRHIRLLSFARSPAQRNHSRRRESGLFMAIRATAAFSFLVTIIANALNPQRMAWTLLALPNTIRWFGVFLGLLAILSAWWLLRSLGNNVSETVLTKKNHQLVMIGPYRWVRHPMYTTGIALCVAIGIMQASWLLLLVAAAMVLLIQFVIIPAEERALTAKFGAQYQAYMTQTGRWLPRL